MDEDDPSRRRLLMAWKKALARAMFISSLGKRGGGRMASISLAESCLAEVGGSSGMTDTGYMASMGCKLAARMQ